MEMLANAAKPLGSTFTMSAYSMSTDHYKIHVSCEPLSFLDPTLLPFMLVEVLELEPVIGESAM
jgi:hypothetical protein